MAQPTKTYLGLDVGTVRVGVAVGDSAMRIAVPQPTIDVDGSEIERIIQIARDNDAHTVVVGYPRNQSGEPTKQTEVAEAMAEQLRQQGLQTVFQDESLTSVQAEGYLKASGKPYTKGDIDARAAALILTDFLEKTHEY